VRVSGEKAQPTFKNCEVSKNWVNGFQVSDGAKMIGENLNASENGRSGIVIEKNSSADLVSCKLFKNYLTGLYVQNQSSGQYKTVEASENGRGIVVDTGSSGEFSECRIEKNMEAGILVGGDQTNPTFRKCRIRLNNQKQSEAGVLVLETAKGQFLDNTIDENFIYGICVTDEADPLFKGNKIEYTVQGVQVIVQKMAKGTFEGNQIKFHAAIPEQQKKLIKNGVLVFDDG